MMNDIKIDLLFPGSSFVFPYYTGIVAYLQDTFGKELFKENKNISISCVSAGAWNATILAMGLDVYKVNQSNREMVEYTLSQPMKTRFTVMYKLMIENADKIISEEDVQSLKKNKLRISVSEILPKKNKNKNKDKSKNKEKDDISSSSAKVPTQEYSHHGQKQSFQAMRKLMNIKTNVHTEWSSRVEFVKCLGRTSYIPIVAPDKETRDLINSGVPLSQSSEESQEEGEEDRNDQKFYMDGIDPPKTVMQNLSHLFPYHTKSSRQKIDAVNHILFDAVKMRGNFYKTKYWLPIFKIKDFDKMFWDGYEDAKKLDMEGEFKGLHQLKSTKNTEINN